jgi:hypothetical protein
LVVGEAEKSDIMPDYKVDEQLWQGCKQAAVDIGLLGTWIVFEQSGGDCRVSGKEEVMLGQREMAGIDADILTTLEQLPQMRCDLGSEGFERQGCS